MNNFTIICLIAVGPFIYGSLIRTTIMNEIGSDDYDDYDETITPSTTENDMSFTQQMLVDNSGENSEQGTTFIKNRNADLSTLFKRTIENLRHKNKKVDVIFLIDSSSSVGKKNFQSEMRFVKKLLGEFNVSFNYTRVAVVTFSSQSKVIRQVDQISNASINNNKCSLLNDALPKIDFTGGGTFTYGALKEAKLIFQNARRHSKKLLFLITDGFSNGLNPIPLANELKKSNVTIITIGIQSGNYPEIYRISSSPGNDHSFLLDSFNHFESLARLALHFDYKLGTNILLTNAKLCNNLCKSYEIGENLSETNQTVSSCCDENAHCTCGTSSGHYSCVCNPGYYGSGIKGDCQLCPNSTFWHSWNQCRPCPDINHIILITPAVNSSFCACKSGFQRREDGRCDIITCPQLEPPENGYFVEQATCNPILHAACGTRCKSGYQLTGSSIRLCLQNGTWSGTNTSCVLKSCPPLPIPHYGSAVCKNFDLNNTLIFDYTTRNETFMAHYEEAELRITEPMPIDTDCNFKCGPGFYLSGSASRNCLPLSKWNGLQTACKQILCSALSEVPFGEYDPTDCTTQKIEHGSNCTLTCAEGFELKGPMIKSCGGKRTGTWSQKNKHPRCVDIQPPTIICPESFSIALKDNQDFAILKFLPPANVSDNSQMNVTVWNKPSLKENGTMLSIGNHTFTYVAVDFFKNKVKCNFTITVLDITPPVFENCDSTRLVRISTSSYAHLNDTYVDWDEPVVYDNSNTLVNITQSIKPGFLEPGFHEVKYTAIDQSGNENNCQLNITVDELKCESLQSPANGLVICAKNVTNTWCELTCNDGFLVLDAVTNNYVDGIKLLCNNYVPEWQYDTLPDCAKIETPESVEQVISIPIDLDKKICYENSSIEEMKQEFLTQAHAYFCNGKPDCEIVTDDFPICEVSVTSNIKVPGIETLYNIAEDNNSVRTKRAVKKSSKTILKIRTYKKVGKILGIWNKTLTKIENMRNVKNVLLKLNTTNQFNSKFGNINIAWENLELNELINCGVGSIKDRYICVECPRGTFHNKSMNTCENCRIGYFNANKGKTECLQCPSNHSTRKVGSKTIDECKAQCPPGTIARIKSSNNLGILKTFMPYCKKCSSGEYQPYYDQIICQKCPTGYTSPRGSEIETDCTPHIMDPCLINIGICGPHGVCIPEDGSRYLYSCICEDGFYGSHCEQLIDQCLSFPCYNGGTCHQHNYTDITCSCPESFYGQYCELQLDPCNGALVCLNGGTCSYLNMTITCECPVGFEGIFCEKQTSYCDESPCETGSCVDMPESFHCICPAGLFGRRCHLKPCDYLPCHKNAICYDLFWDKTNRTSFRCVCPLGLKGVNCDEILNPCESSPCRNNAECYPLKLRDLSHGEEQSLEDSNVYLQYKCVCPPFFYGNNCEIFVTPDYVLEFPMASVNSYIELEGPAKELREVTFCSWIQTNDSFNYGTLISYATPGADNMFTFTDYNGFVFYINNNNVITDLSINDGEWHFICAAWISENGFYEIYLDGRIHQTGFNLSAGSSIEPYGTLIIGQDQDEVGSSFSETESYVGKISYLDIWDEFLPAHQIEHMFTTCEPYQGNLYAWSDFKTKIKGSLKVYLSKFCQNCTSLQLQNGLIYNSGVRAFHRCNMGYKLYGNSERFCSRSSKWTGTPPQCRLIKCGYLLNITNGIVKYNKASFGSVATYVCDSGYELIGNETRICLASSQWSGEKPFCLSIIMCSKLLNPFNGKIKYANEKGRIETDSDTVPVGTLAELQCDDGFTMNDNDNLLTCLENGQWDLSLTNCISSQKMTNPQYKNTLLETDFWREIKNHFFYGCENHPNNIFCNNASTFNDLSQFELPNSKDLHKLDDQLLKALTILKDEVIKNKSYKDLNVYNFLQKLTGISNQLSTEDEKIWRILISFHLDIMLNMYENQISMNEEDSDEINKTIKLLLADFTDMIYLNYIKGPPLLKANLKISKYLKSIDAKCELVNLMEVPKYSIIFNVTYNNQIIVDDIDKIDYMTLRVPSNATVYYDCLYGFKMNGPRPFAMCQSSYWVKAKFTCDRIYCENPEMPVNMEILLNSPLYLYGDEIKFACQQGFKMIGHPSIRCGMNGKWSKLSALCLKGIKFTYLHHDNHLDY